MIELTQTNSAQIEAEFMRARTKAGSPAMGMVMTVVVVVPEADADTAMDMARNASHEHPARVLGLILGSARGAARVDAQVGTGSGWTGETALIRLTGEVVKHPESVVLPLLLPDSPVAVWWPTDPPADPAHDPLGALAQRRITDSAMATKAKGSAMHQQCRSYAPGNTDLAWTRLTPWRALLAAALDQHPLKVTGARVSAEKASPSADLLVAWLGSRLKVGVDRVVTDGPGITAVEMDTAAGPIRIAREDGRNATYSSPDHPDRPVGLRRREVSELLAEELRRLDEDDIYAATATLLAKGRAGRAPARKRSSSGSSRSSGRSTRSSRSTAAKGS